MVEQNEESYMKDHIRQGDVLVIDVSSIPNDAQPAPKEDRVVLAHGEATGHAHAIYDKGVTMFRAPQKRGTYLKLVKTVGLAHEEHTQIPLGKGFKRVIRQTEWTDQNEPIQVAD